MIINIAKDLGFETDFFKRSETEDAELERVIRKDHPWVLLGLEEKIECTKCRLHVSAASVNYQHLIRYFLPARRCDECPKALPEEFPVIEKKEEKKSETR